MDYYPTGFTPIVLNGDGASSAGQRQGIENHAEFLDSDVVGQKLLLAVASVADANGIAVGHTMGDLVALAGIPRRAAERAHARLSVGGALFGFISKDKKPVWVLPDYEQSAGQS